MTQMVRKQIYIKKGQKAQLRRAAETRGVSEAELIRQAIDQKLAGVGAGLPPSSAAWERALKRMRALEAQGPLPSTGRRWTREELYEESEEPHGRNSG